MGFSSGGISIVPLSERGADGMTLSFPPAIALLNSGKESWDFESIQDTQKRAILLYVEFCGAARILKLVLAARWVWPTRSSTIYLLARYNIPS